MTSLKTVDNKSVVIAASSASELEEHQISCSTTVAKLGQYISYVWDIGASQRRKMKINQILYEQETRIDPTADAGSSFSLFLIYSLFRNIEVLVNGTTVYKCSSTDVNQAKMYLQRKYRACRNWEEFYNLLAGDMTTWDATGFKPYADQNAVFSSTVSLANNGVLQSSDLTEFFAGMLKGIWCHRINRLEFRFDLADPKNLAELKKIMKITAVNGDVGRETFLPMFVNSRLRIRYEKFKNDMPDQYAMSVPVVLYHPRYDQVVHSKPFAQSTELLINLKNDFPPTKLIHCLSFYLQHFTGDLQTVVHEGLKYFARIDIIKNGHTMESYVGQADIYRYLNRNMIHEYGHPIFLKNTGEANDGNLDTMKAFIPYVLFKNIHDPIHSKLVDNVLVLSGKNNSYDTDIIKITTTQLLPNHDLICIIESPSGADLFSDGRVAPHGK